MNFKSLAISLLLATSTVLVHAAVEPFLNDAEPFTIHEAARLGNIEAVQRFLAENPALVNSRDEYRYTPLHWAAENRYEHIVRMLLEHGANPNLESRYGDTPLHCAATNGHEPIARMLLEHRANPNLQTKAGETPSRRAALNGHIPIARLINARVRLERMHTALLALLMGLHPRTGANSPIFTYYLPQHVLQQIAQFLRPEHFADQRQRKVQAIRKTLCSIQ